MVRNGPAKTGSHQGCENDIGRRHEREGMQAWAERLVARILQMMRHGSWPVVFVTGALASLSLAPFSQGWIFIVGFSLLGFWFEKIPTTERSLLRHMVQAAWLFGLFGMGWFGASVWWVGEAFLVEAEKFAFLMPFAILALVIFLALFWAAAGALSTVIAQAPLFRRWPLPVSLAMAAGFAMAEYVRGHVIFGGFPWNMPVHGLIGLPLLDQAVALYGRDGLSFLAVFWGALPASMLNFRRRTRLEQAIVVAGLVLLIATGAFGFWRLRAAPPLKTPPDGILLPLVRIVQPNVPQREKWRPENRRAIFRRLLALSTAPSRYGRRPDVIVWPESAVPFLLADSPLALRRIAGALSAGQLLITGSLRRALPGEPAPERLRNAILVIDDEGRIIAHYDKRHLVPFGEYLPLAPLLEPLGVRKLVPLPRGFAAGDHPVTLPAGSAGPAGPLICYEAIFPDLVASMLTLPSRRPKWLVNITNDAWFGRSIGRAQHLAAARLRSIEFGLPLVRVANTGLSAAYDGFGRPLIRLVPNRPEYGDFFLPRLDVTSGMAGGQANLGGRVSLLFSLIMMALSVFRIPLIARKRP